MGSAVRKGPGSMDRARRRPCCADRRGGQSSGGGGGERRLRKTWWMLNSQSSARGRREALPVSRLHGGARGSSAPPGKRNGQYRHGERTKAAIAERQKL